MKDGNCMTVKVLPRTEHESGTVCHLKVSDKFGGDLLGLPTKDVEDYPARYKRLYQKYLGYGFKTLSADEAIDLINAMQQVIHDLKMQQAIHDIKGR